MMMAGVKEINATAISRQNISFYNGIAAEYDAILNRDANNAIVRKQVADRFTGALEKGWVLDFGGGTGQDIAWLSNQSYNIIFCEPSDVMRKRAAENNTHTGIVFLQAMATDFRQWSAVFPFEQQLDAVLANFAVINCIPDIALLFQKLALVIRPGGMLMALLLEPALLKRVRINFKATVQSFFSASPVSFSVDYNGNRQQVYIHSLKSIKKATLPYFEWKRFEKLEGSGFCLIHLTRK